MLVTENGNRIFDVELSFRYNKERFKLERDKDIITRTDILKLLKERRRSVAFTNYGGNLSSSGFHKTAFFLTLKPTPNSVDTPHGVGFHIRINWQKDMDFLLALDNFACINGIVTLNGLSEINWLDGEFVKNKLPLIFDYYLVSFIDKTAEDEAEIVAREENKLKSVPNKNANYDLQSKIDML